MNWNDFKAAEDINSEHNIFIVECHYQACVEINIAYIGDNGFFYSEETHNLLPVKRWSFMPDILTPNKHKRDE